MVGGIVTPRVQQPGAGEIARRLQPRSKIKKNNQLAALVVVLQFVAAILPCMEEGKNNQPVHWWWTSGIVDLCLAA